jgi:hypothetical protein
MGVSMCKDRKKYPEEQGIAEGITEVSKVGA